MGVAPHEFSQARVFVADVKAARVGDVSVYNHDFAVISEIKRPWTSGFYRKKRQRHAARLIEPGKKRARRRKRAHVVVQKPDFKAFLRFFAQQV